MILTNALQILAASLLFSATNAQTTLCNVPATTISKPCTVENLKEELATKGCELSDDSALEHACKDASIAFGEISNLHYQFDKSYMDGGTIWNDGEQGVAAIDESRITRALNTVGAKTMINWPEYEALQDYVGAENTPYMSNFNLTETCNLNTVMCCFTDVKEGSSFPFETNVCSHDLADSRRSNHIQKGWAEYDSGAYCTGFTFSDDDATGRFKGNSLFDLSFMNTYSNDYTKNIPGAPMCACIEKMPTVEEAACRMTTVTDEAVTFTYYPASPDGTTPKKITVSEISAKVEFSDCVGGESGTDVVGLKDYALTKNIDLSTKLVGPIDTEGNGGCDAEKKKMRNEKFWVEGKSKRHEEVDEKKWQIVVGNHLRYYPIPFANFEPGNRGDYGYPLKETDDAFREAAGANKEPFEPFIIRRLCDTCVDSHVDIYYKRFTPIPQTINFLQLLMNQWSKDNNVMGVDFNLYSTYEEAVAGHPTRDGVKDPNAWTYCNYSSNDNIGFPRDCGPHGWVSCNWNSYRRDGCYATTNAFYYEIKP
mmetsp:Transcript_7616/g.10840  ORF Transcript_7616/g.10840 Transcript_7616/m.10840 type:complete len:538 (+) Transcript_7616:174-1787(+)